MKKPENCSRCKGLGDKAENLVNFLHNPIAPYFSSAYVTIISVVCGIALAAVFYMAVEQQVVRKDSYHPPELEAMSLLIRDWPHLFSVLLAGARIKF